MADGEWISGTMGDFKQDPMLEIVYEDGRPSHFQEKTCELHEPMRAANQQATNKHQNDSMGTLPAWHRV